MHRFYAPDLDRSRATVALPADEARHLTRVLRLTPGAIVAVFDGKGREFAARIDSAERDRVNLEILEPLQTARESPLAITLAQAVLKADKMDDVVRDAVMLGVTAIQPVVSSRAETSVAALQKARRTERWRRIAVASAKQCGRARVPDVREPVMLDALLAGASGNAEELKLALVEPSQHQGRSLETLREGQAPSATLVLIGPEGGWRDHEVAFWREFGFEPFSLGRQVLRVENAVTVLLGQLGLLREIGRTA